MEDLKTEFEYVLVRPFEYAFKGNQVEASFIQLKAPTSRNSRECAYLKQAFWRSADPTKASDAKDDDASQVEITGQDVLTMIAMSRDVELADVLDTARHLFTKGDVAQVDGEVRLTKPLIDLMSQDDLEAMLGEYLVNFTLASSLAQTKARSSKA